MWFGVSGISKPFLENVAPKPAYVQRLHVVQAAARQGAIVDAGLLFFPRQQLKLRGWSIHD